LYTESATASLATSVADCKSKCETDLVTKATATVGNNAVYGAYALCESISTQLTNGANTYTQTSCKLFINEYVTTDPTPPFYDPR